MLLLRFNHATDHRTPRKTLAVQMSQQGQHLAAKTNKKNGWVPSIGLHLRLDRSANADSAVVVA